jgi:hypothetical protein
MVKTMVRRLVASSLEQHFIDFWYSSVRLHAIWMRSQIAVLPLTCLIGFVFGCLLER